MGSRGSSSVSTGGGRPRAVASEEPDYSDVDRTLEGAGERWFEYEWASAINEYLEGTPLSQLTDGQGGKLSAKDQAQIVVDAQLLDNASKGNSNHRLLFRGTVVPETLSFQVGQTVQTGRLQATSPSKAIAKIYTDVENVGGSGKPVMFRFEHSKGVRGYNRDSGETVLPRNQAYRVTRVQQVDGILEVTLYEKK